MLDQMSAAPGKPIPAACGGDWAAEAAYRFFDNPRVTEHSVLAGHFAATAARVAASEGPILILQDTSEFIYSRAQPGKTGFTKTINAGRYKAGQPNVLTLCGVLMHSSLAVTSPARAPSDGGEVLDTNQVQNARAQAAHLSHPRADRDEGELPLAGEPAPVHRACWRARALRA
ncbi:transposase DNA-binding-containing protein [Mesorhizobium sp.]|uniref:transposase DNA-binding-containing protein n=1 Tax=Mesorhizobium sp. TaxID=1871066 RepID=UPI0025B93DEC|nr:transposase DNA-binding-containing protein [Mesorhizobium sp.]